jgi:hypothetical protein
MTLLSGAKIDHPVHPKTINSELQMEGDSIRSVRSIDTSREAERKEAEQQDRRKRQHLVSDIQFLKKEKIVVLSFSLLQLRRLGEIQEKLVEFQTQLNQTGELGTNVDAYLEEYGEK